MIINTVRRISLVCIALLFNLFLIAQGQFQIADLLRTSFDNAQVKFHENKVIQLNKLNYSVPFVENIDVRSETNDFDIRKQDLTVRISTNNSASRRAYHQYHQSVQHMSNMEYNSELLIALSDRYELIVDFVFLQEHLIYQQKIYDVAIDKVKLLKRMVSLASFDIVELIQAEDDVYRLQRTMKNQEAELENLSKAISMLLDEHTSIGFNKEDIVQVEEIKLLMAELSQIERTHPDVEIMSARHYNAMMEHEWENAKSAFSLGFIQAKYGRNPERGFESNFSLGVGFDFPLKGSSRLDLNEKKINILNSQSQYISTKEDIVYARSESEARLTRLIEMHELLTNQIKEGNADYALQEYSKQSVASPLSLIKLMELNLRNEMLLLEIEEEIAELFVYFLRSTGVIAEKPYRNFLDSSLPLIEGI